jgi:hypothetical protein
MLALALLFAATQAPRAHAWGEHRTLTKITLQGLRTRDEYIWRQLQAPVVVTTMEEFLKKAFGEECSWPVARDAVFEGVGKEYRIFYAPSVAATYELFWDKGYDKMTVNPVIPASNPHAPGALLEPLEIMSVYSDEPDWQLDDDVPRLKGKGLSKDAEGTATRVLRHFWYRGEDHFGIDFGKDQETDRRLQLYYEMSLIAFSVNQPYWGFRFLANALHYVQDISQPFHSRGVLTENMIHIFRLAHAWICDLHWGDSCKPGDTLDHEVMINSWIMGTYHALFEDFVTGMLSQKTFNVWQDIADPTAYLERTGGYPALKVRADDGLMLDGRVILDSVQSDVLTIAEKVGNAIYETFGFKYKYDEKADQKELSLMTTPQSFGMILSTSDFYMRPELSDRQWRAYPQLVQMTRSLLSRTGTWGRQFVTAAFDSLKDTDEIARLRASYAEKCVHSPSRAPR